MANTVVIDVEARFIDHISGKAGSAEVSIHDIGDAAKKAQDQVDKLGRKKARPDADLDDRKFLSKMDRMESKLKRISQRANNISLHLKDNGVTRMIDKIEGGVKRLTGRAWNIAVKIGRISTAPFRAVKNALFSIKTLVAGIMAGFAVKKGIMEPISLADQYSGAKIGFQTLLGDSRGRQMMDQLDDFAKATPFKTAGVIASTQKMLAMGWNADNIIDDLETIGDAAAATGKGTEGLDAITRALSQIRSKGKLSSEELNQLAEAGISAKRYLAEGLGYGSGDEGIMKLSADLEKGAIGAEQAITAILEGMKEYKGMMDRTANETVEGLKSQIEDTFEINVLRRWGQGLQDGAKRGLGFVVELLDKADGALTKFGDTVYDVGKVLSSWAADKLENTIGRITDITDSYEFDQASLGGKIKLLWKGAVADPFKAWIKDLWSGEENIQKAADFGEKIARGLTKGILAILGVTDIFEDGVLSESGGANIAQGFARGFVEGFDVSAITDKLVDAIGNVWGALPTWAKVLIGGWLGGKAISGLGSVAGGIGNILGGIGSRGAMGAGNVIVGGSGLLGLIGRTGVSGVGASGILGGLANAGYALMGGTSALSVGGGMAALAGAGGILGGIGGGAAALKGGWDLYKSYRAYRAGDRTEGKARLASGGTALGAMGTGAGIGALVGGPLGALIGAGVGGVAGLWGGSKWAEKIRTDTEAAKYESEEMKKIVQDTNATTEQIDATFDKAVWQNLRDHFGDMELSMSEIKRLAEQITIGSAAADMDKFKAASQQAEASLEALKSAGESTGRWMWKAGLGVKFNDDEIESITQAFDDYMTSAKSYVENKHYEFTAAVSLLLDTGSGTGKDILEGGNAYFGELTEKLNGLGEKLSGKVEIALKDGVITLDEAKEIENLQGQIAEIASKLADAEADAKLETIKIKFGGEQNISFESFQNLQTQLQATMDEQIAGYDEALTASITNLNLRLKDGAIDQAEYDRQVQALTDGYEAKVEGMKVKATNMQLEILADSYSDILGKNGLADIQNALQSAIDTGLEPVQWSDEKIGQLLGVENISAESARALRQALQSVLENGIPDQVEKTVGVDITGVPEIMNQIDVVAEEFGIPKEKADTIALLLYGNKEIMNQIDVSQLAGEFGIPESQAKKIIEKLTGEKSVANRISVLADDFGIPDIVRKTVTVQVTGRTVYNNPKMDNDAKQAQLYNEQYGVGSYRGGIVGGDSAMDAFYRGGRTDGGIVGGSTRFIRVNEESPEMIIPLSSQRRERALKLWEKTGQLLNVPGFARGGSTGGNAEDGIRYRGFGDNGGNGGEQNVQIDVGGIELSIQVNGNGTEDLAEAVRAQAPEIAETVAGIIADSLAGQFENTPARGGAA